MTKLRGKIMQIIQLSTRKKQALATSILIIIITLIFITSKAWATSSENTTASKPKPSTYEEYKIIKLAPSTTTSYPEIPVSSTTTTKPVVLYKKPAKTTSTTTVPTPETNVPPVTQAPSITGDWVAQCHTWAAQAGIELDDEAILLIDRESDCSPTVLNPSSKAGGIPQALPFSKTGCALTRTDEAAVCQLKWMHSYVFGKYGGWAEANRFWECIGYCSYKTGVVKNKTATWY